MVGIKVADDASWEKVEKGELGGLSLAGVATLEAVEGDASDSVAKSFVAKVKQLLGIEGEGSVPVAKDRLMEAVDSYIPTPERAGIGPVDHYIPTPDRPGQGTPEALLASALAQMLAGNRAIASPQPVLETPGSTSPLGVNKGFNEKMLRAQMWRVSEALSDSIREVLDDEERDATKRRAFRPWSPSSRRGWRRRWRREWRHVEMAKVAEARRWGRRPCRRRRALRDPARARQRIEALEKATAGRQSVLGGGRRARGASRRAKGLQIV